MKKKTKIFLAIGGVVLIAGGIFYWNFRSSPTYSLLQIKFALEDRSFSKFEKYVDIDGTMSSLMDQVVQILQNNPAPPQKGSSWANLALGMGLFDIFKPQLALMLKPQIQQWVESGKFKTQGPFSGSTVYPLPSLWQKPGAFTITGIEYEKTEGRNSLIGIGIKRTGFDTVLVVNIKMRNKGGYWQVAELTGLTEFQREIERLEQKRIDQLNKPIKDEMDKNLKVAHLEKIPSESQNHHQRVKLKVAVQNIGIKTISAYRVMINLTDPHHVSTREIMVNSENAVEPAPLSPQKTLDFILPEYGSGFEEPWLLNTSLENIEWTISVEVIKFADGTNLQLHQKWQED